MTSTPPASRSSYTWLVLAALAAALFVVLWLRPMESLFRSSPTSHKGVGQSVPSAVLEPLTAGASAINLAEKKGYVVLLSFWGTWCPPCREELPHLAALARQFAGEKFHFVAVSCGGDSVENLEELRTSTNEYLANSLPGIAAHADTQGELRAALQQQGAFDQLFPTTLLIDRAGEIRAVWEGYRPGSEQEMERLIADLLVKSGSENP